MPKKHQTRQAEVVKIAHTITKLETVNEFDDWSFELNNVLEMIGERPLKALVADCDDEVSFRDDSSTNQTPKKTPGRGAGAGGESETPDDGADESGHSQLYMLLVFTTARTFHHLFKPFADRSPMKGGRAYEALARHCQPRDILTYVNLSREVSNLRFEEGQPIDTYLQVFSATIDRFNTLARQLSFPVVPDNQKAAMLIVSMPASFSTFISSISSTIIDGRNLSYESIAEKMQFEARRMSTQGGAHAAYVVSRLPSSVNIVVNRITRKPSAGASIRNSRRNFSLVARTAVAATNQMNDARRMYLI